MQRTSRSRSGGRSRSKPGFQTRAASTDSERLSRRTSQDPNLIEHSGYSDNAYEPNDENSQPKARDHSLTRRLLHGLQDDGLEDSRPDDGYKDTHVLGADSLTAQLHKASGTTDTDEKRRKLVKPIAGSKLGTFDGVFVPTTLNVLSILMFLRFGFILGQAGVVGTVGMLIAAYLINLVTTLSLSAIATNGTVRGGGAYYLISRSLGPEFGGSIGIVFYLGFVFNTGLNAVGLVDSLRQNYGSVSGDWGSWLLEGFWWQYLWATIVLAACTLICLAGSGVFARASNALLLILLVATYSIPVSTLAMKPFKEGFVDFTGYSWSTFKDNFLPHFTRGAAGSQTKGKENFASLFGILFPATGGIFAGASMSGDLKYPSKAIPKGTLYGLLLTFITYLLVILSMAATMTRSSFYRDGNIIQDANLSGVVVLIGELASTLFSTLMGVIGSAKLLQAIARDSLLPGLDILGRGTKSNDEPLIAILVTFAVTQVTMLADLNQIASFMTMTYLMTFLVINLACFLLKLSSAPNFRPSFRYFNIWTAAVGTLVSGISMFFVDGGYASGCVGVLVVLFLIIHFTTPPKSWGDVSQSLIYHQVRKYLLKLKPEHVKFWRPQIVLFVNDPRRNYRLVRFCNSLKKGGLFILGHVIVTQEFRSSVPEARKQQQAWNKYIELSKVKAFNNVAISPALEWGFRNILLSAGLGGMRPNIAILGMFNLRVYANTRPLVDLSDGLPRNSHSEDNEDNHRGDHVPEQLPTDTNRAESDVNPARYVTILEDLLLGLQINVAIARGFKQLQRPQPGNGKKFIDLWPIQMSAEIAPENGDNERNILTTNFDTYTLILQLGCILNTVPAWKKVYKLRVAVFVEYESEVEEERRRVQTLLENLRIKAEVLVLWLASGHLRTYEAIVNGDFSKVDRAFEVHLDQVLQDEEWWTEVQTSRGRRPEPANASDYESHSPAGSPKSMFTTTSYKSSARRGSFKSMDGAYRRLVRDVSRRRSSVSMGRVSGRLSMTTHRLRDDLLDPMLAVDSDSDDSRESDEEDSGETSEAISHASSPTLDERSRSPPRSLLDLPVEEERGHSWRRSTSLSRIPDEDEGPPSQEPETRPGPTNITWQETFRPRDRQTIPEEPAADDDGEATSPGSTPSIVPSLHPLPRRNSSRPRFSRRASAGKFSSRPVPRTEVSTEDGLGPSIMFTESIERPSSHPRNSIYHRIGTTASQSNLRNEASASGYPAQQSVPLSFNDLPCRAQHLILNELMQNHSDETGVLFTTLPGPVRGTGQSEEESLSYLTDLEVLCENLPPLLLVHSNSMTVTMNL